jgi:predicted nucleic acid-binding protein
VLVAYADPSDPDHQRCLRLLDASTEDLITTELVVAETGWLIDRQLGPVAEAAFSRSVARGELTVE